MQDTESATYYLIRAEQESDAARDTTNALAASIHLSLAERYRAKADECQEVNKLRLIRE